MARCGDDCKCCGDCGTPLEEITDEQRAELALQKKYNEALKLAHGFVSLNGVQVSNVALAPNTDITDTVNENERDITFKVKMKYGSYEWRFLIQCDDVDNGAGFCLYLKNMILINTE